MSAAEQMQEPESSPADWYEVQRFMVNEIILAHQILGRKVNDLRARNQERTAVGQKLAAEEISRIAGQLKVCADILIKQSTEFLNRNARV